MIAAVAGLTERQLNECAFESKAQLEEFFRRHQWRAEKFDQLEEAGELVSVKRMGLNPQTAERLRGRLGLWVMRSCASASKRDSCAGTLDSVASIIDS